jgi:(5-formylfuran-3-yl)methyl phosphate synthase
MTRMLASVLDATEAEIALDAGADIIDLKDARNGALGALSLGVVGEALKTVGGRRPVSATLGNLPMEPELLRESALALGATGIDFVKVGLFDEPSRADCIEALAQVAGKHRLVGVLFADQRPALDLLAPLARAGFAGVMVDTMAKSGSGLRRHMDQGALRDFVAAARAHRLFCGLAGSLGVADIAPLLVLEPDYLGFRSALCAGAQRDARLDATAVAAVRRVIPQYLPTPGN